MIDWNMGRSPESSNSGRKTQDVVAMAARTAVADVTAGRFGVDGPTVGGRQADLQYGVTAGLNGLAVIESETRRLARAFRGANIAAAHRDFETLVEAVRSLTMLTAELGHAAAGDEHRDSICAAPSVCATLGGVANALESLIDAHSARDWARLADKLESELTPALRQWRSVFTAIVAGRAA